MWWRGSVWVGRRHSPEKSLALQWAVIRDVWGSQPLASGCLKKKKRKKRNSWTEPQIYESRIFGCAVKKIAFLTSYHLYACLNLNLEFGIGTQDFRFTAGSASNILWLHTLSEFSRSPLLPHPLHKNYLTWLFRENMFLFFNVKAFFENLSEKWSLDLIKFFWMN